MPSRYQDDIRIDPSTGAESAGARLDLRLKNARDMIFRHGGAQLILPVMDGGGGHVAAFRIAMVGTT